MKFAERLLTAVLRRLGLLETFNYRRNIKVSGESIVVPILGAAGYANLSPSEPWLTRILSHLLPARPGSFIDVGVNLGQTLIKVKAIDRHARYVGFEPNPHCVAYVRELIRCNAFENCDVVTIGLSDRSTLLPLDLHTGDLDSTASLVPNFRPGRHVERSLLVPVFALEDIRHSLAPGPISFVKIDVEGGELEVLLGLRPVLEQARPFVLCEILPVYQPTNVFRLERQKQVLDILVAADYTCYRILHSGRLSEVDDIGVHSDLALCDYLFTPREYEAMTRGC